MILAVLLVNGDDPALQGALFVGLFDADVSNLWEVTQGLQLLT